MFFKKQKRTKEEQERINYFNMALKWMYEMEVLDNAQIQDNLYGNVYSQSKRIKDAEILIDQNKKTILIWIKLDFLGRIFKSTKKRIAISVIDSLQKLLPKYAVRLITKRETFDLAIQKLHQALKGDLNEKPINTNNSTDTSESNGESGLPKEPNPVPDIKE